MPRYTQPYRYFLGLLGLSMLAGVALAPGPAQAASGAGPYFPEPAWDQKLSASKRFLILTNWNQEAVLDKETGLVWERLPAATTHTWTEARIQCTSRTTGNRKGWRLPSVHELDSLLDPSNGFLPTGHPFLNLQLSTYWSATTSADNTASAFVVAFNGFQGGVGSFIKTGTHIVWCVRGGMNADQY